MTRTPSSARDALVVIPCLNEVAHLDHLLAGLITGRGSDNHTIVVADGGSTDGSLEIARRWSTERSNVHVMHNAERLQSAGVNVAVSKYGQGATFLVRVDAHASYPTDYVDRLVNKACETAADSVVVPMATEGSGCFQTAVAMAQNSRLGTGGAAHRMGGHGGWVDHGHHALMRLDRYRALNGYDPRFSHNEDAEYDTRLRKAGGRIWLAADLSLGYVPRATASALFRQYINYGRGRARTVRLHQERLKPRQAAPLLVGPAVAMTPLVLLSGLWPGFALALFPPLIWATACLAGGLALARKGPLPCSLLSGPAAMIMHLAWSLGFWAECLRPALEPRPEPDL